MQNENIITNRERVNKNISRLNGIGKSSRTIWFAKRRYGNL